MREEKSSFQISALDDSVDKNTTSYFQFTLNNNENSYLSSSKDNISSLILYTFKSMPKTKPAQYFWFLLDIAFFLNNKREVKLHSYFF